ncbi:phosphodiester glycosidase family protein [Jeotgalibacillus sp. JSM ZJ347]|uniref:phosphodiester glycosidase family protein n=1 Tax=Jeotgalibacillus sp. JSM ZJ347 TaxID=3342117 RepID=UPI0035A881D7
MKNQASLFVFKILVVMALGISLVSPSAAASMTLSPGISHESERLTVSGYPQAANITEIDLTNPYAKVNLGVPSPINSVATVSKTAMQNSAERNHVVGAINASFFHLETRLSSYLVARNNKIDNLGGISASYTDYMFTPAAFGVNSSGKAMVDRYDMGVNVTHNGKSFTFKGLNKVREADEGVLFTPGHRDDRTMTNSFGLEVVVRGVSKTVDHGLEFGEKVTGKVSSIRPYGQHTSATIPDDGYVLSAQGTEAAKLRDMKVGDSIDLNINVDQRWQNAEFMLASGPLLVQDGVRKLSIDPTSPRTTSRAPRTAVAVDRTGEKVFMVTVDGRQAGHSAGMTLPEFANYLVNIGAHQAINLDGGGSTAMVTRKYGNPYATLVNKPSDGWERSVSATIQAVSTAPYGSPRYLKVSPEESGAVFKGNTLNFKADYVLDQYFNPLTIDQNKVTPLSVEGGVGEIVNGEFKATNSGSGSVVVGYEGQSARVPVTVTDKLDQLLIAPSEIRIGLSESVPLSVKGRLDGQTITLDEDDIELSVSGNAGAIANGRFIAAASEASGTITAKFGSNTASIPVTVTNKPFAANGFESVTPMNYTAVNGKASGSLEKVLQPKQGSASLKLDYDFRNTGSATSAAYVTMKNGVKLPGRPEAIGAWVYGDGENHWLRGTVEDANGRSHTISFTEEGGLDWKGWKFVEADVPGNLTLPLSFKSIYIAETSSAQKNKGFIYIDDVKALYTSQYEEPAFTNTTNVKNVNSDKVWTVRFSRKMDAATLNNVNAYVTDQSGVRQNVAVKALDGDKLTVTPPSGGYTPGKTYQLVVTRYAESENGILMDKDSITTFKIN